MSRPDGAAMRLIVRDGTSQDQRLLAPLQDGYFNPAELSFASLLAMAHDYAGLVNYYTTTNQAAGDWRPYFSADETIVLARMLAVRLSRFHVHFDTWWESLDVSLHEQPRRWDDDLDQLPMFPLAQLLDGWLDALSRATGSAGRKLHALLETTIDSLRQEAKGYATVLAGNQILLAPSDVRANYHSYVKAIEMVQQEAQRQLPDSLVSGDHEPGAALLIAFIRMAQRLDTRLNRFTSHHIDFYYDRVLRAGRLAAVPDHAYLVVAPTAAGNHVEIPPGAAFIAKCDGQELAYYCDDGLLVSDARVQALHTLYFHCDPLVMPEAQMNRLQASAPGHCWPSSVWTRDIAPPPKQLPPVPVATAAQPLLGAPRNGAPTTPASAARLGFAIASSVLSMREGRRQIKLALQFTSALLRTRLDQLERIMRGEPATQTAESEIEESERAAIRQRLLGGLFVIELTGPAGWISLPWYYPTQTNDDLTGLQLECELPIEAPPVVAYNPLVHGENFATSAPVIRLRLNPDSYVYPYGLLRDLDLAAVAITVEVAGYRQLSLNNQLGQLDPSSPFQPFGPLPVVGSYLIVGIGEAATKNLSRFHLDLDWAELPELDGGFTAYYHDYSDPPANHDYVARVEALADGVWGPNPADAPQLRLFADDYRHSASRRLLRRSRLQCDQVLEQMGIRDVAVPGTGTGAGAGTGTSSTPYSTAARDGYLKLTLAAPSFAFGHREYPQALSHAMRRSLRNKHGLFMAGVPEAPYTPLVAGITASYTARAEITLRRPRNAAQGGLDHALLHLHPQGWQVVDSSSGSGCTLLPAYSELGYLHIGLTAGDLTTVLTLFFHLQNDSLPQTAADTAWSYLADNTWRPLPPHQLLSDSTGGFMTSGVVSLRLPPDIGLVHTVMPSGLYWLRIGATTAMRQFSSLYNVYTQGLCVRRAVADMQATAVLTLPAGAIGRSRDLIPGLGKVSQLIASRGGRLVEDRAQRHTRIAERLRHKGRAVTPADYEALILERFPEIHKVKCFPNLRLEGDTAAQWRRPGEILIVVLPALLPGAALHSMPQINGLLVAQVAQFVKTLAPPAARIDVRHPVYEQIQVRCTVQLRAGLTGGRYINRLNQDLSRFLSPWNREHDHAHFGWSLREHDVESFILGLDYIADVSGCSLLRVAPTPDGGYTLTDTALHDVSRLSWTYPWSVAVAIEHHLIAVSDSKGALHKANLHTLDIGSTFIISSEDHHGAPKS